MLILSRKRGETIEIGTGENAAIVTVVEINGNKIRLGIQAPRSLPVHRGEVADAIRRGEMRPPGPERESA